MATANPRILDAPVPENFSASLWNLLPIVVFGLAAIAAVGVILFIPERAQLALTLPLIAILVLTMIVRPELALVISVAYIPFESDRFILNRALGALSISKVLGFALLGVFAFNIIFRRRPFRLLDDSQDFLILLLAGAMLFSGVMSEFPDATFGSVVRMLRMFAFYVAVKNLIGSPVVLRAVMWAMILSGVVATIVGINEYNRMNDLRIHDVRVGGVYQDPNDYAQMMIFTFLIGLYLFEATRTRWLKGLIVLSQILIMVGVILSGSRGALLAFGLGFGIYVLFHPRRQLIVMLMAISVIVAFPFVPDSLKTRLFGSEEELGDSTYSETAEFSVERRTSYLVFGSQLIAESPLIGVGYGSFSRRYPRSEFLKYANPLTDKGRIRLAHNSYLEIASGVGFVGLALFLGILLVSLRDLYKAGFKVVRGSIEWAAAHGFLVALAATMVASFFLSIEHNKLTWIAVAVASALAAEIRHRSVKQTS